MADNPAPVALAGVQQAARARHDAVYAQLLAGEVGSTWTITVGGERGAAVTAEKTGQDALQVIFGGFSVKAAWSVEEQLIKASQAPLRLPSVASAFNLGFQSDNPASYFQLLLLEEVGLVILTTAIRQKYNIPHTLEISDPRTLAFKAIEHSLRNIITNVPVAQREATLLDPSVQGPLLFNLAALGRLGLKAAGAPTQKFDEYVARSVAPSGEMDSIIMAAMARGRVRPAGNPTNRDGYRGGGGGGGYRHGYGRGGHNNGYRGGNNGQYNQKGGGGGGRGGSGGGGDGKFGGQCFRCGEPGHMAKQCNQ